MQILLGLVFMADLIERKKEAKNQKKYQANWHEIKHVKRTINATYSLSKKKKKHEVWKQYAKLSKEKRNMRKNTETNKNKPLKNTYKQTTFESSQ